MLIAYYRNTILRRLKNYYHLLQAVIANFIYGFPGRKLIVIGVTGTDGKSTVSNLIYQILLFSGENTGVISTVGCKINNLDFSIGLHTTTPSAFTLQKLLKKMVDNNCKYAVIEVASHGIDQKRIWGIPFKIGVLTNITREHLDYHKSFNEYVRVKLSFLEKCEIRIINFEYSIFNKFSKFRFKDKNNVIHYGLSKGEYRGEKIERNKFLLRLSNNQTYQVNHQFLGQYNVENILAAIAACYSLGIGIDKIIEAIKQSSGIKGRMEKLENNQIHLFVDFAHTPNAIKQVLTTLRAEYPTSKIIHVFGATGKRDKAKRPIMGEISGELSDYSILTTEDTYGENPEKIIEMIENGIKKTNKIKNITYFIEPERKNALKKAIAIAREGDVVIATGVGHQTTLNVGHEIEWSDQDELKKILNNSN